jgi:hypothetical protein
MAEISPEEVAKKWSRIVEYYEYINGTKHRSLNELYTKHDCYEWNDYVHNNGYPYIRRTVNKEKIRIGAHQVVALYNNRRIDLDEKDSSHLCGNKLCILDQHIVLEPHDVNLSRKKCHDLGKESPVSSRCNEIGHNPKCFV